MVSSPLVAAAKGSGPTAFSSLQTALVAVGAGLLFTALGFLLFTDFRGARGWLLGRAEASLDDVPLISRAVRQFNVRIFRDEPRFAYFRTRTLPLILGAAYMDDGVAALITGLVSLVIQM